QTLLKPGNPGVQLFPIDVFETVLKFGAANAVFNGKVLYRLHEESDAVDFVQLRLEAANHITGTDFALGERLQVNLNAAGIEGCIGAVNADKRGEAFDRRVLQDDVRDLLLMRSH